MKKSGDLRDLTPAESLLMKIQDARVAFSLDRGGPNSPLEGMLVSEGWISSYFDKYKLVVP